MIQDTRDMALVALYTALTAAVGLLLAPVPNVELISASVVMGGWLFGAARGIFIGACGAALFSIFNPNGSGLVWPPMLIVQILCWGMLGGWGSILRRIAGTGRIRQRVACGITGALFTAGYSVSVSLAAFFSAGFPGEGWKVMILGGLVASGVHITINTAVFALLVPELLRRLRALHIPAIR